MIILNDEGMEIKGERPSDAVALLLMGLEQASRMFIEQHPDICTNCPAFRQAQLAQYHLAQLREEMDTIIAAYDLEGEHDHESESPGSGKSDRQGDGSETS